MVVKYKVIYSQRKSLAIIIKKDGEINVRAPKSHYFDTSTIDNFVNEKKDWIIKNIEKIKKCEKEKRKKLTPEEEFEKKKKAKHIITEKINNLSKKYGFKYKKLRISSAKTRWGSCSSTGTISINWNLIFAPEEIINYVIIHELCHTRHHNHSKNFWLEVEKYDPNYKINLKWLRDNEHKLQ